MPQHTTTTSPPIPGRKPQPPAGFAMPLVDDDLKKMIKRFEGSRDHFYQDTRGNVTIGAGFMVPDVDGAKKQELFHAGTGRRATDKEKEDAFNKVKALPFGNKYGAQTFDPDNVPGLPNLRMREKDIDTELEERLKDSETELRTKIPRFGTIPNEAQKGLMDMQFNMGGNEFNGRNWPKLYQAIDRRDWAGAAKQSTRGGVNSERNQAVQDLFMEADRKEKQGQTP